MSTDQQTIHTLKVAPPYFAALADGSKTFEVRANDRAYQRGDLLVLREWHSQTVRPISECEHPGCQFWSADGDTSGHWALPEPAPLNRTVTFVYSGDPRIGGVEPGFVVLALGPAGVSS